MLEDFYKSDWQVNTVDYQSFPKGIGTFIGLLLITIERLYDDVESLYLVPNQTYGNFVSKLVDFRAIDPV